MGDWEYPVNALTVPTHRGEMVVDLPVASAIRALAETCAADDTVEGVATLERLAAEPVTLARLADAKELRDEAHSAHSAIEALRKAAKAPFTAGGKAVDSIAADVLDRLATIKAKLSAAIARTEAEAEEPLRRMLAEGVKALPITC